MAVHAVYIWTETQSQRVKADGRSQGNLSSAGWQFQSQQREFPLAGLSLSSKKENTWEIIFEEETPANHCY